MVQQWEEAKRPYALAMAADGAPTYNGRINLRGLDRLPVRLSR